MNFYGEGSEKARGVALLAAGGLVLLGTVAFVLYSLNGLGWLPGLPGIPSVSLSGVTKRLEAGRWFGGDGVAPVAAEPVRLEVDRPEPQPLPGGLGLSAAETAELRRVQQEHLALIASIPPAAVPEPAAPVAAEQELVSARVRVLENPAGIPAESPPEADWFNPERGLHFFRLGGGDHTGRRAREANPYRDLFYYEHYPATAPNFHDRSIYGPLARELAAELPALLPVVGEVTPDLIRLLERQVGWELRPGAQPIINVWSSFHFSEAGSRREFAIGGVMRMQVLSWEEQGMVWEYVTPGEWIGGVVVERLR